MNRTRRPKPEAIASGAATGFSQTVHVAIAAWTAPAHRAAGAFAPAWAGAVHAQSFGVADGPLACAFAPANGPGDLPLAGPLVGPKEGCNPGRNGQRFAPGTHSTSSPPFATRAATKNQSDRRFR